jgi:hypothetical protein
VCSAADRRVKHTVANEALAHILTDDDEHLANLVGTGAVAPRLFWSLIVMVCSLRTYTGRTSKGEAKQGGERPLKSRSPQTPFLTTG